MRCCSLALVAMCAALARADVPEDSGKTTHTSAYHYIPGMQLVDRPKNGAVGVAVNSLHSHNALVPFDYYSMPYCKVPDDLMYQADENLGQLLWGDKIESSLYVLTMMQNQSCVQLPCPMKKPLSQGDLALFETRINNGYRANFVVDNLPVIGHPGGKIVAGNPACIDTAPRGWPIGVPSICTKDGQTHIANHVAFKITVNEHEPGRYIIVRVNVEPYSIDFSKVGADKCGDNFDPSQHPPLTTALAAGQTQKDVEWTYSVTWVETKEVGWEDRWDAYLSLAFTNTNSRAHWVSIMNSMLVILCLSVLVAMIMMRALHLDFNRYNSMDSPEEQQEEMGWKLVHGDVFRTPSYAPLFSVIIGTGAQLLGMLLVCLVFALLGFLSPANRGGLVWTGIIVFTLMSFVNGFVVGGLLKMFSVRQWKFVFMSALLYPGVIFMLWIIRESVILAVRPRANTASFYTVIKMMALWLGVSTPLVVLGAAFTFNLPSIEAPCRVTKLVRKIPPQRWYLDTWVLAILPGLVPFGAAFLELRFIMFSMWQGLVYYVFGFFAIMLVAVVITAAETTIVGVYFTLIFEDYRWWWKSLVIPGGLGVCFFMYSILYYQRMLNIRTNLATFMYFETMFVASATMWIMAATIGFFAAYPFVYLIYSNVKIE